MKPDDWFYRAFEKTVPLFQKLIEKKFDEKWFTWLQWVMITAALYAVGEKTGSVLVKIATIFSGAIIFCKAWLSTEDFFNKNVPYPKDRSTLSRAFIFFVVLGVTAIPLVIIYFLAEVFRGIID